MEKNKELQAEELKKVSGGGSIEDDEAQIALKDVQEVLRIIQTPEYAKDKYFQGLVGYIEMIIKRINAKDYNGAREMVSKLNVDKEFQNKDTTGYLWNLINDAGWYL